MNEIRIDRLAEVLNYCPQTGALTWRAKVNRRIVIGTPAGSKGKNGYLHISVDGVRLLCHRVAFAMTHGYWPDLVDHINRNTGDNRIENLREANKSLNAQNQCTTRSRGKHGRGVTFEKWRNRFAAVIHVNGKSHRLGTFLTADKAHQAYVAAKSKYHQGAAQ